jgi:hypothetical protein
MPDEKEVPEVYSDQFMISGGPYGVVINLNKSPAVNMPKWWPSCSVATLKR